MNNGHPFSPEEFKNVFSRVPRLCVDLVIRTSGGVVLTLRTLPTWNNLWHFPGGTVRYGELIEDAIQRVAKQEVGVAVVVEGLVGYMEFPSEEKERGFGWSVSLVFLCKIQSGELSVDTSEASEVKVFSGLPANIIQEHKTFLEKHPEWRP